MARRSAGEGSIYRTPDGGGWMVSLTHQSAGGKYRRVRRRAKTKASAQRILRELRAEIDRYAAAGDGTRLVASAVDDYLRVRQGMQLAPRTLDQDRWSAGLIRAGLGGHRLASLTVDDIDRFLVAAAGGDFGRPMARPQLRRLRQKVIRVIENDQRRGLVGRNVAELSIVPEESPALVGRRPPRALSRDELVRLLNVAQGVMVVAVDLSGRNGLRPAEARALRWRNIDFAGQTLRVEAQMNRQNETVKVKTRRSARTIGFDEDTANRLRFWKDEQLTQQRNAGPAWLGNVEDLVLTTLFGTAINQRNMHRSLTQLCEKAAVTPRISAYDLRHSAVTFQVVNGHPAYRVADWAGTSERMIADVYRHKLDPVSDLGPVEG